MSATVLLAAAIGLTSADRHVVMMPTDWDFKSDSPFSQSASPPWAVQNADHPFFEEFVGRDMAGPPPFRLHIHPRLMGYPGMEAHLYGKIGDDRTVELSGDLWLRPLKDRFLEDYVRPNTPITSLSVRAEPLYFLRIEGPTRVGLLGPIPPKGGFPTVRGDITFLKTIPVRGPNLIEGVSTGFDGFQADQAEAAFAVAYEAKDVIVQRFIELRDERRAEMLERTGLDLSPRLFSREAVFPEQLEFLIQELEKQYEDLGFESMAQATVALFEPERHVIEAELGLTGGVRFRGESP